MKKETIADLVKEFADSVAAQTDCIARADSRTGNRYAKRYIKAFKKLAALGDEGRDSLLSLFKDDRADVRVTAAAFLLRHRTAEARSMLEAEARQRSFTAFKAQGALERWEDGTWALDPDPKEE